ncbi:hypothetical protein, conserved [Eimeria necatrix]|uniref:Uncharacterized protein n=1 Tax=Eimeria necatrix TaxID=51315 RepID=U6N4I7_9EIME|nr:hypothetical protein, conserved [Eimeria necatrix]CDJ70204.1 hypothetical protein, conserved [Eimeria necatrix]
MALLSVRRKEEKIRASVFWAILASALQQQEGLFAASQQVGEHYTSALTGGYVENTNGTTHDTFRSTFDASDFLNPFEVADEGSPTEIAAVEPTAVVGGADIRGFGSFLKKVRACLALFICVGLFSLAATRLPVSRKPVGTGPDDNVNGRLHNQNAACEAAKIEEPRQRIRALRGLLPVAEDLAHAVGTSEGRNLLLAFKESVGCPINGATPESIHASISSSVKALSLLHEAAIQEAQALVVGRESLSITDLMSGWEEKNLVETLLTRQTIRIIKPFAKTIRSLRESSVRLSLRLQLASARLSMGRRFKDERDGNLLRAAAADLHCFREAIATRSKSFAAAIEVVRKIAEVGRTQQLAARTKFRYLAETDLDTVKAYAALVKKQLQAGHTLSASTADSSAETQLEWIDELVRETAELISAHRRILENLESTRSPGSLHVAAVAAASTEQPIVLNLGSCWELLRSLPAPPEVLDEEGMHIIGHIASGVKARCQLLTSSILAISEEARQHSGLELSIRKERLSSDIKTQLVDGINSAVNDAEALCKELGTLTELFMETKRMAAVSVYTNRASLAMEALIKVERRAMVLLASYNLMLLLEQDLEELDTRFAKLKSDRCGMQAGESRDEPQQLQNYEKALRSVQHARTLGDAAAEAAKLRLLVDNLEDMMYKAETEV